MANSSRRPGIRLRLSPGEMEKALREEKKKWRIFRLLQVREQARNEASRVRGAVQKKKQEFVKDLEGKLLEKFEENKENEVQQLQQEYDGCIKEFGQAHEQAKNQPDAVELLAENMAINRQKAVRRGFEAAKVCKDKKVEKERQTLRLNQQKASTLRKEKMRANRIAQLPTPEALKKKKIIPPKPVPKVQFYEHGTLTTTTYVPKNFVIEKELKSTMPTAQQLAKVEEDARQSAREAKHNEAVDIDRKREARGKVALHKERLHRMYGEMLEQLDRAQHDHQLSAFIRGDDDRINETEESRLRSLASHQHKMEVAVERILKHEAIQGPPEEDSALEGSQQEASDLKEVSDEDVLASTIDPRVKGLAELQEEIRKHRLLVNEVINDIHESSLREKGPQSEYSEHTDIGAPDSAVDSTLKNVIAGDTPLMPRISSEIPSHTRTRTEDSTSYQHAEPRITDQHWEDDYRPMPSPITRRNVRIQDSNDDIHLTETVPAHLMPERRTYVRRSGEKDDDDELSRGSSTDRTFQPESSPGEIEVGDDELSRGSSTDRTIQPESSSGDIEVNIHFSSDGGVTESSLVPDDYGGHRIPGESKDPLKGILKDFYYGGDNSTEYLSLPSFSSKDRRKEQLENLEMIQQRRKNIQRLLDENRVNREPKALISPITYMQEMTPEGASRKPLSKRKKFELQKKELLRKYMRKLLDAKEDEMMQITASTVDGSGMTVDTLSSLLESLRKNEDSISSSLGNLTDSSGIACSATYPDIDHIPTKLSSTPEFITHQNLPSCDPRIHTDEESYVNSCQETESCSISCLPVHNHARDSSPVTDLSCSPCLEHRFLPPHLEQSNPCLGFDKSNSAITRTHFPIPGQLNPHIRPPVDSSDESREDPMSLRPQRFRSQDIVHPNAILYRNKSKETTGRISPPSFQSHRSAPSNPNSTTDESSSVELLQTSLDVSKFDAENLQRELKYIQDLMMIQKLKQQLLAKKNHLLNESEETDRPSCHNNETTDDSASFKENIPLKSFPRQVSSLIQPVSSSYQGDILQDMRSRLYQTKDKYPQREAEPNMRSRLDKKRQDQFPERGADPNMISRSYQTRYDQLPPRQTDQSIMRGKSIPNIPNLTDKTLDSEGSEDNFMPLRPIPTVGSSLTSSAPDLRKGSLKQPFGASGLTKTHFRPMIPEATVDSHIDFQKGSLKQSFGASGLTKTHFRPLFPEGTMDSQIGTGTKGFSLPPAGRVVSSTKPENIEEQETPISSETKSDVYNPSQLKKSKELDVTGGPREKSKSSSDSSGESSKVEATLSNANVDSDSVTSVAQPNNAKSGSSSSTSVTSIPDMAEILQRFGMDWATSMIRKMDKAEEHSSSGN